MYLNERIEKQISRFSDILETAQNRDGAWRYCFESGTMTDAYMIILLQSLKFEEDDLISPLAKRLATTQQRNGSWKLYHDEAGGNLSATVEAYYALLLSGFYQADEEPLQKAKQFILAHGGLANVNLQTKVMLALTGQTPWRNYSVPPEIILLPSQSLVSFYDFVGYARVHIAPVLIAAHHRFFITNHADISDLYLQPSPVKVHTIRNPASGWRERLRKTSIRKLERFIRERIESDGTLLSYASCTYFMVFAMLALGYSKYDPVILKAIEGLKGLAYSLRDTVHIQNSNATVWDTALISHALQNAGTSHANPVIQKASHFLLSQQQDIVGDWVIHNPHAQPGGWGFSENNAGTPDVDDTGVALRALSSLAKDNPIFETAWHCGLQWLLSMQNQDGGWPAFEKNTNQKWLSTLTYKRAGLALNDPSSADLTGRTLELLGNYVGLGIDHPQVAKAVRWLIENQEQDGSWYGRWGICYVYGTWAALTGLRAVGLPEEHPAIKKAVNWLLTSQLADGGWGESCKSDKVKTYVPLTASTPSQTAWALDALIAVFPEPCEAIQKGMDCLLTTLADETSQDWNYTYPTGAGLPGGFYIHYHSYRYIWPLLAMGNYRKKFGHHFTRTKEKNP